MIRRFLLLGLVVAACADDPEPADTDADGVPDARDCGPSNPGVKPGAREIPYDGVDGDCDPATPDDDLDGDGWGKRRGRDCDDTDPGVHPGAADVPYDGTDTDCDGTDLVDVDGDGRAALVAAGDDCDDRRWDVNPAAVEICGNGVDEDCSGADQPCSAADRDGDGYSPEQGDCNDGDRDIGPDVPEIPYDGVDEDCSADTPDDDVDGDGFGRLIGGDCDDEDPLTFPGADEIPHDGEDQDCSGTDLVDVDGDGVAALGSGGTDCDDRRPDVKPAGVERCGDGVDQNCDGDDLRCSELDLDLDGYSAVAGDCDEANFQVRPGASEIRYNQLDDDCDPSTLDDDLDGDGFARNGGGDCNDAKAQVHPGAEEIPYDRVDQDCDGKDLADQDRDGHDAIAAGGDDCDDLRPDVHPGARETCRLDGVDQNCDRKDEGIWERKGPQVSVDERDLCGWTVCHTSTYNQYDLPMASIQKACGGKHLMLACRPVGSSAYAVVAHAPRADVFFDTGSYTCQDGGTHVANGTQWYFNDTSNWSFSSWGFAKDGDTVNRCAYDGGPENRDRRISWYLYNGTLYQGYTCGTAYTFGNDYQRVILQHD